MHLSSFLLMSMGRVTNHPEDLHSTVSQVLVVAIGDSDHPSGLLQGKCRGCSYNCSTVQVLSGCIIVYTSPCFVCLQCGISTLAQ